MTDFEAVVEEFEQRLNELEEQEAERDTPDYREKDLAYSGFLSQALPLLNRSRSHRHTSPEERDHYDAMKADYDSRKLEYIELLVDHGYFMKSSEHSDPRIAKQSFEKALKYDPDVRIASYRLGFLHYRHKRYLEAAASFTAALGPSHPTRVFNLNDRQRKNAQLYLMNSHLHLASRLYEDVMKDGGENELSAQYPEAEWSTRIRQNEQELNEHQYAVKEPGKPVYYCSEDDYLEPLETTYYHHLVVGYDKVDWQGRDRMMTVSPIDFLMTFLEKSSESRPLLKEHVEGSLGIAMTPESYRQRVSRLNRTMTQIGVGAVLTNVTTPEGTAYYFNQRVPYVMIRSVASMRSV